MRGFHFIRRTLALLAVLAVPVCATAQPTPAPPPLQESGAAAFTIFMRGAPLGAEQIAVTRTADGWTIVSSGRLGAPIDVVARRVEVRYTADWKPRELSFDGTVRGRLQTAHSIIDGANVRTDGIANGQTIQRVDPIDPGALLLLPSSFFGPFEALAARLRTTSAGSEIPAFGPPALSFSIKVGETAPENIQTTTRLIAARRTRITMVIPAAAIDAVIWTDESGRMIRFSVPAQLLEVAREDIAAVSSRTVTVSRPNDEQVRIAGNGFNLAGTVSKPANAVGKLPAVALVGGSGAMDRDELAFGIPILGEVANALADAGFIVVRYDKRGIGQSGGRAEVAGLTDYAEDLRAAVKFLADRKDVDPKRIAVAGHSEGGVVGLMAAAKDKRVAALALLSTPGFTGANIVLAQQQRLLNRMKLTPQEKQEKVDAQKRINDAVITGKGLETLPPEIRRQVDNAEFQSILTMDPAKLVAEVKQPLLVLQGELDTQVEPPNADQLRTLADKRKKAPVTEVVKLPGVNHLLAAAKTGEVDEYSSLPVKHVAPAAIEALVSWLKKTLSTAR